MCAANQRALQHQREHLALNFHNHVHNRAQRPLVRDPRVVEGQERAIAGQHHRSRVNAAPRVFFQLELARHGLRLDQLRGHCRLRRRG
eukprot:scaffold21055_cov122-Isochrysis_galbana.AAC.6